MLGEVAAKMNFKIMKAKKLCFFVVCFLFWQWIETRQKTNNKKTQFFGLHNLKVHFSSNFP
jgi:hypothetical protein